MIDLLIDKWTKELRNAEIMWYEAVANHYPAGIKRASGRYALIQKFLTDLESLKHGYV